MDALAWALVMLAAAVFFACVAGLLFARLTVLRERVSRLQQEVRDLTARLNRQ